MAIIISRHPGAIAFVRAEIEASEARFCEENNIEFVPFRVLAQASADDVRGEDVIGNLPLYLACLCRRYRAIELPAIAITERGQDLTPDEMCAAGARIVEYRIQRVV